MVGELEAAIEPEPEDGPRARLRRWRWRLSGALQWPTFGVLVVGELVLLTQLPPWGTHMGLGFAFVYVGFLNLVVVAVAGPLAGMLLRRRRPDLPRVIARDHAGTTLLVVLAACLLGVGLLHHGAVLSAQHTYAAESDTVRAYVAHVAPPRYRGEIDEANTLDLGAGLYRTCVPSASPGPDLCLLVDTTESPPGVRLDPSSTPNEELVGPPGQ